MSTIFVGNLPAEASEAELRALFEPFGAIQSLRLVSRRRIAFVELAPEAADAAIEGLRGKQLGGRTLDVALEGGTGGRPGGFRPGGRSRRRR
jgi:RNA recognition motif-containing protein